MFYKLQRNTALSRTNTVNDKLGKSTKKMVMSTLSYYQNIYPIRRKKTCKELKLGFAA